MAQAEGAHTTHTHIFTHPQDSLHLHTPFHTLLFFFSSSSTRPAGSQVGSGLFPWQPGGWQRGAEHRSALSVYLFRSFTSCRRLNQVILSSETGLFILLRILAFCRISLWSYSEAKVNIRLSYLAAC